MDRRRFLERGLLWTGAVASAVLHLRPAGAAEVLFADSFKRANTRRGWGKSWYNQRYSMSWGISKNKGFYELPEPQPGVGQFNPNPVTVLNRDVVDVDITALMSSSTAHGRFGLLARMVDYGKFYAAYLDGETLFLTRFSSSRDQKQKAGFPKTKAFTTQAGKSYWMRFQVTGTNPVGLRVKVWKAGQRQPRGWTLSTTDDQGAKNIERAGMFGFLFMHDAVAKRGGRFKVSKLKATSPARGRKSQPGVTFAFAGRTQQVGDAYRTRVVAKTEVPAAVVFHMSTDSRMRNFTSIEPDETYPKPHIAKAWLDGLAPDTTVYWRAKARTKSGGVARSRTHSLRTPPAAGAQISFAFGSCTHFFPTSRSFEEASKVDPLFFAHLGDLGYAEDEEGAALALRADCFQDRWFRILERPTIRKLHEKAYWFMLQDDHDYGPNAAWRETVRPFTVSAWDQVSGNLNERDFDVRFGDLHCFFLDVHVNADDAEVPDSSSHSLLGQNQKDRLKSAMRDSTANLLVVFSPMPFFGFGSGDHSWKRAFAEERRDLLDFFSAQQGPDRRVLICSGNAHAHYVNRFPGTESARDIFEFVSSGTDRVDNKGGEPLPSEPQFLDQERNVRRLDAFGVVTLQSAAQTPRKVVLRAVQSQTGQNAWPPLELDI